jgi:hypothetical protein
MILPPPFEHARNDNTLNHISVGWQRLRLTAYTCTLFLRKVDYSLFNAWAG